MDTLSEPATVQLYQILVVIFLVVLNGFFVAAEIALVKTRMSQLETVTDSKQSTAVKYAKFSLNHMNTFLAASQLGITLASLALGWLGESIVHQSLNQLLTSLDLNLNPAIISSISISCAFIFITTMHIVFGEMMPKTLAITYPLRVTLISAWPMRILYYLFRPIIYWLNSLAALVLKIFKVELSDATSIYYSEEEIKLIVSDSEQRGAIGKDERELIENIFEFDELKVHSVFTPRKDIKAIEVKTALQDALRYAIEDGHSRYPVYAGELDNIVGIIYTKDLIGKLIRGNKDDTDIADLVRAPNFISENTRISRALKLMQQQGLQLAIATDETGEVSGVITYEDIIEELVGDIKDEHDNEPDIVVEEADGSFTILAHENIVHINKHLPFKLQESQNYDTLAGLIQHLSADKNLQLGDQIEIDNYIGDILKLRRNTVELIRLKLKPHPSMRRNSNANFR